MGKLSPQAQAVLDAALPAYDDEHLYVASMEKHAGMIAAAAIKAVADQVVPEQPEPDNDTKWRAFVRYEERNSLRTKLLAIATELAGANS